MTKRRRPRRRRVCHSFPRVFVLDCAQAVEERSSSSSGNSKGAKRHLLLITTLLTSLHSSLAAMADDVARRALMDQGTEDAVTVNQRALIDKILARYAAEFTVL